MKNIFAQQLRLNTTDAESILWYNLRNRRFLSYKFRRQSPIGKYIVDFVCFEKMLVIELDGGQHSESVKADIERAKTLNQMGYKVIRFWNNEVFSNLNGILDSIKDSLV